MTNQHKKLSGRGIKSSGRSRNALISSILSLVLCVTMLLGTTMAWFTDTVTNTNNRIAMGELDVELQMDKAGDGNYVDISNSAQGDIFSEVTGNGIRWEPGKTEIVFLAVANTGDLALNYNIIIDVTDLDTADRVNPADVLEYAIIDGWKASDYQAANITDWDMLTTKLVTPVQTGALTTGKTLAAEYGALVEDGVDYFALAVHMDENAGNEYMGKELNIDVQVAAKQMASEYDSISNQYDADAKYGDDKWYIPQYENVWQVDFEDFATDTWGGMANRGNNSGDYRTGTDAPSGSSYFYIGKEGTAADGGTSNWAGYNWALNTAPFAGGQEYILTAWVKVVRNEDGTLPQPVIKLDFRDPASTTQEFSLTEVVENEWVKISRTFTAPEGAGTVKTMRIYFYKDTSKKDVGAMYLDNIVFSTEVKETEVTNTELQKFQTMLAEEAATSQKVEKAVFEPYDERELLANAQNLVVDGSFEISTLNVEGTSAWFAREKFVPFGEWVQTGYDNVGGALHLFHDTVTKENQSTKDPWYYQNMEPIVTDVIYQISYWYMIPVGSAALPYIKIETFADPSIPGAENYSMIYDQWDITPENKEWIADGEWHQVTKNFQVTPSAYMLRILPRLYENGGSVYFDNIELYMTKPDAMVSIDTEFMFFYDDELTDTTLTATFAGNYFPEYTDADIKADFQVYDGDVLIWDSIGNTFSQNVAETVFPLTKLVKRDVPYCVKVILRDIAGNELSAASQNIYATNRPEYVMEDGTYLANGETPFYPVLGYHVVTGSGTESDYPYDDIIKAKEAGINLVQLSVRTNPDRIVSMLNACYDAGVMGLYPMYFNMNEAGSEANMQYTIANLQDERITNHPALFGYIVMDEPYVNVDEDTERDMENSYRLIHMYDKKHPVISAEGRPANIAKTAKFVDIIIADLYKPAKNHLVHELTGDAIEYMNGRPVYTMIKAYSYDGLNDFPTPSDAQNNMWQALIAGAKGAGYFGIRDGYNLTTDKLPCWTVEGFWEALVEWSETTDLAFEHYVRKETPTFNEKLVGDYWYSSWVKDDSVYMLVLGMQDFGEKANVSIPLTSTNGQVSISGGTVELISGTDAATIAEDNLVLEIEGVDVALYKITPNTAVDFSALQ